MNNTVSEYNLPNFPAFPDDFPPPVYRQDGEAYVDARDLHSWMDIGAEFPLWWRGCKKNLGLKEGVDYTEFKDEDRYNKLYITVPLYIAWVLVFCTGKRNHRQKLKTVAYLLDCEAMLREIFAKRKHASHDMT